MIRICEDCPVRDFVDECDDPATSSRTVAEVYECLTGDRRLGDARMMAAHIGSLCLFYRRNGVCGQVDAPEPNPIRLAAEAFQQAPQTGEVEYPEPIEDVHKAYGLVMGVNDKKTVEKARKRKKILDLDVEI